VPLLIWLLLRMQIQPLMLCKRRVHNVHKKGRISIQLRPRKMRQDGTLRRLFQQKERRSQLVEQNIFIDGPAHNGARSERETPPVGAAHSS
jgi:hypothetical protein